MQVFQAAHYWQFSKDGQTVERFHEYSDSAAIKAFLG